MRVPATDLQNGLKPLKLREQQLSLAVTGLKDLVPIKFLVLQKKIPTVELSLEDYDGVPLGRKWRTNAT